MGEDAETVLIRIRAAMPTLRPSERRIAEEFTGDPAAAANLSIAELAARCETSTTSVVRFYQRMGYAHYKDFRFDLTRAVAREELTTSSLPEVSGDIDRHDSLEGIVSKVAMNETLSIADTARAMDMEALGDAVTLLLGARRIDTFGVGASALVGLDLQQKLSRIGRTAINWHDAHSAWTSAATLDGACVAVAVSHTGATTDTIEFLAIARASGASTVAITNFRESPLAGTADVTLTTAARETRFRSGALGSRIAQLMVVDCLFTGVAQASYDASMEALRNTYAVVHDRAAHRPG
ncbi:MurR/RpiR family transcriptional regulator [Nonomuraea sp. KC401]|uniref:MurR/RpiR family transcriptional regulator n=1 Tax=Nonomuraea longispora TaxID=1848320 RepID=A0A4R4NMB7_9ACTN|nr:MULTISPECIES: MurR/RpiR family transcriptional regulator [Nonomuraea]NBE93495.1 SIS domain-containing protein [Nonomuraea sp. K271]TDC10339.1 MurR/RpiR family transcriptional regulator [Nonomuraea longispora]TLF81407.1 MurR/RpiR family transcriptional regulator [Nonomuraea sp. KC401]